MLSHGCSQQQVPVSGSPFQLNVMPAPPFAPNCFLSGTGCAYARPGNDTMPCRCSALSHRKHRLLQMQSTSLLITHLISGRSAFIWVHLTDRWNNACTMGSSKLIVRASGPTQPIISTTDVNGVHRSRHDILGILEFCIPRVQNPFRQTRSDAYVSMLFCMHCLSTCH